MNKLRFVEIYRGKDEQWKGFYNVFIDNGGPTHEQICIGLMEPVASKCLIDINNEIDALKAENKKLSLAFQKLIDLAQECDGWESFPQGALDEAQETLSK